MLQSWHIFLGTFSHSLMGSFSAHPFSNPSPEMVSQVHHHHPWVGEEHAKRPVVNLAFRLTHTLQLFSFQMYFMFDLLFSQIRCVTIASFASYKWWKCRDHKLPQGLTSCHMWDCFQLAAVTAALSVCHGRTVTTCPWAHCSSNPDVLWYGNFGMNQYSVGLMQFSRHPACVL